MNPAAAPSVTNTPVIFDVPALYRVSGSDTELMIAASGGAQWGGCEVWVSYDGSTYTYAGSISKNCNYGTLTSTLATSGTAHDTTNTLSVSLVVSGGTLATVDGPTAAAYLNEAWVGGEIISPQTATLTGANTYNLTGLYRGGFGTTISSHASGANFVHLDDAPLRIVIPAAMVGSTVYVKLPAVNLCGANLQSLASCTPFTYSPAGAAFPQPISPAFTTSSTGATQHPHPMQVTADPTQQTTQNNGSTTTVAQTTWVNVTWAMPVGAPNPDYFEVVGFTGSDPTANQVFGPMDTADGTSRGLSINIGTTVGVSGLNVGVRSIYVNQ